MAKKFTVLWMGLITLMFVLAACAAENGGAAASVENYYQALVAKDEARLANLSCSAWEAQARAELNSFAAVEVSLEDLSCQESGAAGDFTLVTCTGKIMANYGAEVLEINLADRTYQAAFEGNEWRMCGYQ